MTDPEPFANAFQWKTFGAVPLVSSRENKLSAYCWPASLSEAFQTVQFEVPMTQSHVIITPSFWDGKYRQGRRLDIH